MWKKAVITVIVILMLSIAFVLFTFNISAGQDAVAQLLQEFRRSISTEEAEYVKLTIYLLESDLGHSMTYSGNETSSATPLPNAYIMIGGETAFTDSQGKAYVTIPKGNHTLSVVRKTWTSSAWTTSINAVSDGEVRIAFYLFRIEASSINAYPEPFKDLTNLRIAFKLPTIGRYYVGEPTITYYTPWGQIRAHYWNLEISEGVNLYNVWDLIYVNYQRIESGGQAIEFEEEIRGFPTYIHPKYSFLPVEKVEVEEKWLRP